MRATGDLIIEPRQARELVITRTFAAPRQLVFDAWTQPKLLRQWYGPRGWQLTTCEIDLRAGGRFLFVLQRQNRADMALRGTFQAVDAPTRLATSERWDDWTEGETTTTTMFDERDGVTTVTRTTEFTSAAARDRALGSVGREGLEEAFERLDDLVRPAPDDDAARPDAGQRHVGTSDVGRDRIADRYRRRAARFEELIRGAGSYAWASQSPCHDWTARDVVDHVVDMHAAMLAPLGRSLGPESSTAAGPIDAFTSARARLQHALDDPAVAGTACDTPTGTLTFAEHVDAALSVDLVLHGWDLARATGQDDTIQAEDLQLLWPIAKAIPEQFRVPGAFRPGLVVFGPQVPVAADAPLQDKILGLYGRDPAWPDTNRSAGPRTHEKMNQPAAQHARPTAPTMTHPVGGSSGRVPANSSCTDQGQLPSPPPPPRSPHRRRTRRARPHARRHPGRTMSRWSRAPGMPTSGRLHSQSTPLRTAGKRTCPRCGTCREPTVTVRTSGSSCAATRAAS